MCGGFYYIKCTLESMQRIWLAKKKKKFISDMITTTLIERIFEIENVFVDFAELLLFFFLNL